MKKIQTDGFAVVESLLILIIVGLICFVGWYIYHAKQNTDNILKTTSTARAPIIKKHVTNTTQPVKRTVLYEKDNVKIVNFISKAEEQSVEANYHLNDARYAPAQDQLVHVSPGITVIKTAPKGLFAWAQQYAKENPEVAQNTSGMEGMTIDYISKNGKFAHGGSDGALFFADQGNDTWIQITEAGGQSSTGCDVIEKYAIPTDILPICMERTDGTLYYNQTT